MKILCELCDFKCQNYDEWVDHLLCKDHQIKTLKELLNWTEEMNERSIIIQPENNQTPGIDPSDYTYSDYFSSFGIISDYLFHTGLNYAIIQFDTFGGIQNIGGKWSHVINKVDTIVRILSHLAPLEKRALVTQGLVQMKKSAASITANQVIQRTVTDLLNLRGRPTTPAIQPLDSKRTDTKIHPFSKTTEYLPGRAMQTERGYSAVNTTVQATPFQLSDTLMPKTATERSKVNGQTDLPRPAALFPRKEHYPRKSTQVQNVAVSSTILTQEKSKHIKSTPGLHVLAKPSGHENRTAEQQQAEGKGENILRNQHMKKRVKKKNSRKGKSDPFFYRHKRMISQLDAFDMDTQLQTFTEKTTMDVTEKFKRNDFLNELTGIIRSAYPSSILYSFGSFVTGLGDLDSDLDIFVDAFGNLGPGENVPKQEKKSLLRAIANCLYRTGEFSLIHRVNARVPIIRLVHRRTAVKADLSFENLLSVQNSKLISFYINFDPRVRPLLLITRYWGRFHGITGCNLIKSYGLVLLVLVFLMKKKIIPSVHQLQVLAQAPFLIDNWNATFCDNLEFVANSPNFAANRTQIPAENTGSNHHPNNVAHLNTAKEFFEMFAALDFGSQVICTLIGEFLPRKSFTPGLEVELPPELERYCQWICAQEPKYRFDVKSHLCIQDPFNLGFNVGGCCPEGTLVKFKTGCASASAQLTKILASDNPKLMDLFEPLPPGVGKRLRKRQMRKLNALGAERRIELNSGTNNTNTKVVSTTTNSIPLVTVASSSSVVVGSFTEVPQSLESMALSSGKKLGRRKQRLLNRLTVNGRSQSDLPINSATGVSATTEAILTEVASSSNGIAGISTQLTEMLISNVPQSADLAPVNLNIQSREMVNEPNMNALVTLEHKEFDAPSNNTTRNSATSTNFCMDDFKRFYSNNDVDKSVSYFWDKFDPENYSIWFGEYQYNDELTKVFMSCNLITGMYQRLGKMNKIAFASVCLFGDDNNSSISGIWIWRCQDLAFTLKRYWQNDYMNYNWTKLDPKSELTKKMVKDYFSWEGTDKKGRKFNQGKIFK